MQQKFLFQPLDKMAITQHFGENKACVDIKTGTKYITCDGLNPPKGYKSMYSQMDGHNGIDYATFKGQPIYSAQDGIVTEYVAEDERGLGLGIQTDRKHWCKETGEEEYFKIRYWHNYANLVKKGDKVTIGQVIALSDSTGYSSGNHLHFEIKPVTKTGRNRLQNNRFFGAVDPEQYLLDEKASAYTKYKTWQERLVYILFKYLSTQ